MYTERFSEMVQFLAAIGLGAHVGGNSTAWVHMQNYHRAVALIWVGNAAGTVDGTLYQATDEHGTGAKAVTGKSITQLTATDDNSLVLIELRTEELDVVGGFDWIRLSCESSNVSTIYGAALLGFIPRFKPVSTALLAEVVD
jgi:hypothetical protein